MQMGRIDCAWVDWYVEKAVLDEIGSKMSDVVSSADTDLDVSVVDDLVSSSTVADKEVDLVLVGTGTCPLCPMEKAEEQDMLRVTSAASQTRL